MWCFDAARKRGMTRRRSRHFHNLTWNTFVWVGFMWIDWVHERYMRSLYDFGCVCMWVYKIFFNCLFIFVSLFVCTYTLHPSRKVWCVAPSPFWLSSSAKPTGQTGFRTLTRDVRVSFQRCPFAHHLIDLWRINISQYHLHDHLCIPSWSLLSFYHFLSYLLWLYDIMRLCWVCSTFIDSRLIQLPMTRLNQLSAVWPPALFRCHLFSSVPVAEPFVCSTMGDADYEVDFEARKLCRYVGVSKYFGFAVA